VVRTVVPTETGRYAPCQLRECLRSPRSARKPHALHAPRGTPRRPAAPARAAASESGRRRRAAEPSSRARLWPVRSRSAVLPRAAAPRAGSSRARAAEPSPPRHDEIRMLASSGAVDAPGKAREGRRRRAGTSVERISTSAGLLWLGLPDERSVANRLIATGDGSTCARRPPRWFGAEAQSAGHSLPGRRVKTLAPSRAVAPKRYDPTSRGALPLSVAFRVHGLRLVRYEPRRAPRSMGHRRAPWSRCGGSGVGEVLVACPYRPAVARRDSRRPDVGKIRWAVDVDHLIAGRVCRAVAIKIRRRASARGLDGLSSSSAQPIKTRRL
jgi:hypothetical protein